MANLIVRNVDDDIAKALKQQANLHGVSAEAEHRNILKQVLTRPTKKSFLEVLSEMPDIGNDDNFKRIQDTNNKEVFD